MKINLKKILINATFFLLVAFFGIDIASASTSFWPDQIYFSGNTSPVLVDGVNNGGIMHFDEKYYTDNGIDTKYRPYLQKVATEPFSNGQTVYEMRGWTWNDNLGWVSFYCQGGSNLGASCGAINYKIELVYNSSDKSFSFKGYAWNDATGWISLNYSNHGGSGAKYGLRMNQYGTIINDYTQPGIDPYVWSSSIGWLDFKGVYGALKITVVPDCTDTDYVGVCPKICVLDTNNVCIDPSTLEITPAPGISNLIPVADGTQKYTITLAFKNSDGTVLKKTDITDTTKYDIRMLFKWNDTIKRNQISGSAASNTLNFLNTPLTTSGASGAVLYKPVLLYTSIFDTAGFDSPSPSDSTKSGTKITITSTSQYNWSTDETQLYLYVKSVAPTTGGNRSLITSTNKTVANDLSAEKNNLQLNGIDWIITDKVNNKTLTGTSVIGPKGNLNFRPAIAVSTLNTKTTDTTAKDTLLLYRNVPSNVEVKADQYISAGTTIIKPLDPNTKIQFNIIQPTTTTGTSTGFNVDLIYKNNKSLSIQSTFSDWPLFPSFQVEAKLSGTQAEQYTEGAKLNSVVSYDALVGAGKYPISYPNNFLPRTPANISNPVAVIQGTLYGTGISTQKGVIIQGIGDGNTNVIKDMVYENIQKLIRNISITSTNTITLGDKLTCPSTTSCATISTTDEDVVYVTAKKVLLSNNGNSITWSRNKVLVVNGGNLFINDNLYNGQITNKLGIVVIRNIGNNIGEAGNIYIAPNVTNIQAFAVIWGVVFSYDGISAIDQNTGEVAWSDEPTMINTLNKQLIWQGGISSYNTIGGSDLPNYYLTGYEVLKKGGTNDTDNMRRAKLYDLNYLRFFRAKIQYDASENPWDTSCGKNLTQDDMDTISNGGTVTNQIGTPCDGITTDDLTVPNDGTKAKDASLTETNPVYIKYVPPNDTSKVFGKEKTLTF